MKRIVQSPRNDFREKIESLGFDFHQDYWLENACYEFSSEEIGILEEASRECYNMYCEAVERVIRADRFDDLCIPRNIVDFIKTSWEEDDLSLYGRFDFAFDGTDTMPKLLEFNADTPTSLLEASVIQWQWLQDKYPQKDQYNAIHEILVQSWKDIHEQYGQDRYYFACEHDYAEDTSTLRYLLSTAQEAELPTAELDICDIGFSESDNQLTDPAGEPIDCLFKLYPWEWMFNENLHACKADCLFIEPLWKSLMSNKAMLALLWEFFPDSPYLLPAYKSPERLGNSYCRKPVFSREGANISLVKNGNVIEESSGDYGAEGLIYQKLADIVPQHGKYPVIGSWIIGGEPAGIGIRETDSRITDNLSYFVPHYF